MATSSGDDDRARGSLPRVTLTALYVPGDRPDRVAKARASGADAVIIDLEDAVAPAHKDAARALLGDATSAADGELQVRVNARGSSWSIPDLEAVAALPADVGVRVPKVESAADIAAVAVAAPGRPIHALIESALGIERAFEIAASGVASVALGEADLRSQLGLPSGLAGEPGLQWARSRLAYAAAAAGLPAPMMSVYADIDDLEGLAESCAVGRALGFVGRTAIHPRQLPVIEAAFTPSAADAQRAREIIERVASAQIDGVGTVVLHDGTFLDIAMVDAARRTIAIADRIR